MTSGLVKTDDNVNLYYEEAGSRTPLVFVHEFAADCRSWEPQLRYFSRRYRAIAYNARRYPPSDVPNRQDSYSQQRACDDIRAVLDGLGIDRAHIVGLSMGGFGALRLGALYAERVAAISAHSSITRLSGMEDFIEEPIDFMEPSRIEETNVIDCMLKAKDKLPPLRFDCGSEDPLIEDNRALHAELDTAGVAHEYREFPGGHEWPYWREHLRDTLAAHRPAWGRRPRRTPTAPSRRWPSHPR